MIDRNLKNLNPKDFVFVILYGVIISSLFAFFLGFLNYLISQRVSVYVGNMLFWVFAIFIGKLIRKQSKEPHLLYVVIAGLGMIYGATIITSLPALIFYTTEFGNINAIFSVTLYLELTLNLLNPINWITNFSIPLLLQLTMIGFGMYIGLKQTTA